MNKLMALAGAVGVAAVLASCGSASTPDGSASLRVTDLRTEYVDASTGEYVACDNVFGAFNSTNRTAVAVTFTTSGAPSALLTVPLCVLPETIAIAVGKGWIVTVAVSAGPVSNAAKIFTVPRCPSV